MSDPVSKTEIEDVLASIRRLVTVEDRAPQATVAPVSAREEDKLILTPSQRIDESEPLPLHRLTSGDDDGFGNVDEASDEALRDMSGDSQWDDADWDAPEEANFEAEDAKLEDEDAAFEAEEAAFDAKEHVSEAGADEEVGLAGHDPFEQDDPDREVINHTFGSEAEEEPQAGVPQQDEAEVADPEPEPEVEIAADLSMDQPSSDAPEEANFKPAPQSELEARIAEVEAAVAAKDDEWEPDGSLDDDMTAGDTASMEWQDELEDIGYAETQTEVEDAEVLDAAKENAVSQVTGEEVSEPEIVSEPAPVDTPVNEPGLKEEAAVEPQPVTVPEPVAESTLEEVYEAEVETLEELREAEAEALQEEASIEAEEDEKPIWAEDDDAILDEEALRDMVSEIVRQELQGALGERITRNVRKLVRREIHRALMSQGIE